MFCAISNGSRTTCSPRSLRRLMPDITIAARIAVTMGDRIASGVAPSPSPGSTSAVPETPITVMALASLPRPRRAVREGAVVALGEAERVLAGLAHGRHVANLGAR